MDRDEALKLLRGGEAGITEWNQRRKNGEPIPDLNNADLREVNLFRANLDNTNFIRAILREADLRGVFLRESVLSDADLGGVDLRGANLGASVLSGVDLGGANLSGAILDGCIFSHADLSGSILWEAHFRGAYLLGTNMDGALCENTEFANLDLSSVYGLETVTHIGPSSLGVDTLYASQGKIPQVFLRGCGVPERLIQYLQSQFHPSFRRSRSEFRGIL